MPERPAPEPEEGLPFIDCHCHLPWTGERHPSLPTERQQLLRFAKAGGVHLVSCSIDLPSLDAVRSFVKGQRRAGFCCGWPPQTVTFTEPEEYVYQRGAWERYARDFSEEYLALGEVGLDFHHATALAARQRQADELRWVLKATAGLGKPYVLHVRNASPSDRDKANPGHPYDAPDGALRAVLAILAEAEVAPSRVLWHCFSGPPEWGPRLASQGFTLSVPSSAWGQGRMRKNTAEAPLERLVTETDAPFQHPWLREPSNEPANARYAVAAVARSHGVGQREAAEALLENARRFFGIEAQGRARR